MFASIWSGWLFGLAWLYTFFLCGVLTLCTLLGFSLRAWPVISSCWSWGVLRIIGVTVHCEGGDARVMGPAVFVANHQSFADIMLVPSVMPAKSRYLAKAQLARIPIWGHTIRRSGLILVDRTNRESAIQSIRDGMKMLPRDYSVTVFPEGTRSPNGEMRRFKKGVVHMAIASGLDVVPVGIAGARAVVPPGSWIPRPGHIEVTVGQPMDTSGWRTETCDTHLAEMREAVVTLHEVSRARWEQRAPARGERVIVNRRRRVVTRG